MHTYYMRIYVHTYIHTYIHTYVRTYVRTYVHTYIRTYVHTYIHTYIHTNIHTYIHTYIRTYVRTYIRTYVHTYIHTYIHTYSHTDIYRESPIYYSSTLYYSSSGGPSAGSPTFWSSSPSCQGLDPTGSSGFSSWSFASAAPSARLGFALGPVRSPSCADVGHKRIVQCKLSFRRHSPSVRCHRKIKGHSANPKPQKAMGAQRVSTLSSMCGVLTASHGSSGSTGCVRLHSSTAPKRKTQELLYMFQHSQSQHSDGSLGGDAVSSFVKLCSATTTYVESTVRSVCLLSLSWGLRVVRTY